MATVVYVTTIYCVIVIDLFAVQFAKAAGAIVYATASTRSLPHVRALGVDEVIDYRQQKIELLAGAIDLVVDLVGGEVVDRLCNRSGEDRDAAQMLRERLFLISERK